MAELKKEGRHVRQPDFPDLSGAAHAYSELGRTIKKTGEKIGSVVDSSHKAEAEIQYTTALNDMNRELVTSLGNENIAKGNAYQRYLDKANAIKEGVLPNIRGKYQQEVKNLLDNQINKLGLKIATQELDYSEKSTRAQMQAVLSQQMKELDEAFANDDKEAISNIKSDIDNNLEHSKNIGAYTEYDNYKIREKIESSEASSLYTAKFDRLLKTDTKNAITFMNYLANNKPKNLTNAEWEEAKSSIYKQYADYLHLSNASNSLANDEFELDFAEGKIKSKQDVDNFILEAESKGYFVSPNAKLNMFTTLANEQNKRVKSNEDLIKIDEAIASGSDAIYDFSPKALNKYYTIKSQMLEEEFAAQKQENPDAAIPSRLAIRASVAAKLPTLPDSFVREFGDKLQIGSIQDFQEAIVVGNQLLDKAPKRFSKLPKETQSYFEVASNMQGNTTLPLELIREYTNNSLLNRDAAAQEKIDKSLSDLHNKSPGFFKDLFKNIYDVKFINPTLQPQYNNMVNVYEAFYRASGDKKVASKLTQNFMRTNSGPSKYVPKGDITKNPIEETELYQKNPIFVDNQIALGAWEILKIYDDAKKNGWATPYKIEWPDDVEIPDLSTFTTSELHEKNIWVNHKGKKVEPQLKIDGKNRKLFLMNPNTDLDDPSADRRDFYFEGDEGIPIPIFVTKERTHEPGVIAQEEGIANMEFKTSATLTPEVDAIHKQKILQDQAIKHLRAEFRAAKKAANKPEPLEKGQLRRHKAEEKRELFAGPNIPRPNPFAQVEKAQERLKEQEEESEYIVENLEGKKKQLKENQQRQINQILKGGAG